MVGLDILVNDAGIGAQGTVETATDDEWRSVLDANAIGTARVSKAAWPHLRHSGYAMNPSGFRWGQSGSDWHGWRRGRSSVDAANPAEGSGLAR